MNYVYPKKMSLKGNGLTLDETVRRYKPDDILYIAARERDPNYYDNTQSYFLSYKNGSIQYETDGTDTYSKYIKSDIIPCKDSEGKTRIYFKGESFLYEFNVEAQETKPVFQEVDKNYGSTYGYMSISDFEKEKIFTYDGTMYLLLDQKIYSYSYGAK